MPQIPNHREKTTREAAIVIAMLTVQAGLLAWIGWVKSPVLDELGHLASGMNHLQTGQFDLYRVNPPLVRCVAAAPVLFTRAKSVSTQPYSDSPLSRPEFQFGQEFVEANGGDSFFDFSLARWACIPLILFGGFVCYRWARELYGGVCGHVALSLWCLCPNILAWGATITPDAAAASMAVFAGYMFWRWLQRPTWDRTLLCGAALGLAALTKTSLILLFALWPVLWLIARPRRQAADLKPRRFSQTKQLGVMYLVALYLLNLGYGFHGSFQQLGEYEFISCALTGHLEPDQVGNRFAGTPLAHVPVPLPESFVRGIDVQKRDFERGKWSYLRGEWKHGGWWYYYLYAFAVKTPGGVLGLLFLAAAATIGSSRYRHGWNDVVVLVPACVLFVVVSAHTGFSRYFRYVLPALPFLFVFASKLGLTFSRGNKWLAGATMSCLLWAFASSLACLPHGMSYFNTLSGGPRHGHDHLVDANIDWGQDLLALKRWHDGHPEANPLRLAFFGWVDPKHAGLEASKVPRFLFYDGTFHPLDNVNLFTPGWYAVSVNHLRGYIEDGDQPFYTYMHEFQPVARAGYSVYIYHISADDIRQFRDRNGLSNPANQADGP